MSTEEAFVQWFARLFVHHRDALTLDTVGEDRRQVRGLNEMPAVGLDRMISGTRPALPEIEDNAREQDDAYDYYCRADRTVGQMR
jgi:hypothetical protein